MSAPKPEWLDGVPYCVAYCPRKGDCWQKPASVCRPAVCAMSAMLGAWNPVVLAVRDMCEPTDFEKPETIRASMLSVMAVRKAWFALAVEHRPLTPGTLPVGRGGDMFFVQEEEGPARQVTSEEFRNVTRCMIENANKGVKGGSE